MEYEEYLNRAKEYEKNDDIENAVKNYRLAAGKCSDKNIKSVLYERALKLSERIPKQE